MVSSSQSEAQFQTIHPNAAGIDIGADRHWVSVPPGRDQECIRSFGCFTPELNALADWLKQCGIETVAMESTGVYWIPLFQILETRGFEVRLVNAHHVKTVPGRKSDGLDCQWLQRLHSCGLLTGSFRPNDQVCQLRSYIRYRDTLVTSASTHVLRMQKALTEMNVQLHRVISDITGSTGMRILRAIAAGERNPEALAAMRDTRIKASQSEIAAALTGDYRTEQGFILQQELHLYDTYQRQITACDVEIERLLNDFTDQVDMDASPPPKSTQRRTKKPGSNTPEFDLHTHLYRMSGVDFTQVPGLGTLNVLIILSEVGLDSSRFPSAKHFSSWLGLCPGNRITGGKVKSSKTRPVVNRAAHAFRMAAQAVSRSQSAVGAFYRRMKSRLGGPKAITATAHKLARIFYQLWSRRQSYVDPSLEVYEQQYKARTLKQLQQKAQSLGFDLVPQPIADAVVS